MPRFVVLLAAALPLPTVAADPRPGEDLFPLAVGNTWTYRVYPGPGPQVQEDRFVVRVVRTEMVGDQPCFLLEGRLRDRVTASEHVAFTKDGLTRFRADGVDITPPVTVLKPPAGSRLTWDPGFQLGDRKSTAAFRQTSPKITYQGRQLQTTLVVGEMSGENGTRVKSSVWYAPALGMVRQQIEEGKRSTVLDLEKFDKGE
jgi:hypothetical protein